MYRVGANGRTRCALKRTFDFVASLFGLCAAALPLAVLILIVRTTSPGPGLFRQTRLGRDCKPFTLYKIRTMYRGTRDAATHEVSEAQVTTLGRWLRRVKLDELPQLWNVLRGDMSLVGPRPCLPVQSELIAARLAKGVFSVRPGVTGLAQVRGVDMSDAERLATLDAEAIAEQTLAGDLMLLWMTVAGGGRGDRTGA